jgi:hypothetical protein
VIQLICFCGLLPLFLTLPAGRAGSVVLWDLRSQEAVGAISPSLLGKPANAPCIGVQLDDWKLVTGWAGSSGASSSSGGSCWWRSSTDIAAAAAAAEALAGHTLELYDIRAAASFSGCGDAGGAGSSSSSSRGMWGGEALMSLAVPNRVTCFQVRTGWFSASNMRAGALVLAAYWSFVGTTLLLCLLLYLQ